MDRIVKILRKMKIEKKDQKQIAHDLILDEGNLSRDINARDVTSSSNGATNAQRSLITQWAH